MRTLNLGILAHVDAGKTSLTERLLFEAGAIPELGSVDAGTTRTDSMDIERRRGITVRTNVASFAAGEVQVNLIDTPGHSDFIAEVERSLAVLDAAVLVVSAVEGVQPQTVVLWRVLRRLAVPAAIFINKIDRQGADPARVRAGIGRRLAAGSGVRLLPLTDVLAAGSPSATTRPVPLTDPLVIDALTSGDDRLLGAALDGPGVTEAMALRSARTQVRRGAVVPVLAGSALTGAGVPDLLTTLPRLMPWARPATRSLSGVLYKIEHGDHGTMAHCRVFGGELRVRHRATVAGARPEVVTSLERSTPDGWARVSVARAGDVVRIRGIGSARTGGWVGEAIPGRVTRQFPAPALESVVEPVNPAGRGRLFSALRELAEADPLINLRVNAERGEIAVSLYGEVQKEVIADLLARQFGVAVTFRPTVTVHIERIAGTGASSALISEKATPYLATLRRRWANNFGGVRIGQTYNSMARGLLASLLRSPDYSLADAVRAIRGITATTAAVLPELEALDLTDTLPRLDCPVVMVQGRHDQVAPGSAAERYAELLTAPSKQFVWFEHSAHMPQLDEPGRFRELLAKVRLGLPANS